MWQRPGRDASKTPNDQVRKEGCTSMFAFPSFEVNRNKFKFLLEKLGGDGSLCVLFQADNGD